MSNIFYLQSEENDGGKANPGVKGIHMRNSRFVMIFENSVETNNRSNKSNEMKNHVIQLVLLA